MSIYDSIGSDKEGNEINLFDIIEYKDEDVVERLMVNERVGRLGKIMEETLSGREKTILIMRYGLDGKKEKTV